MPALSIILGAIWWVKSWTLFLGLISHLLEALYGVSGGFTLTDDFALSGTGLVNLTNNVAWAYLFLIILTPFISYTLVLWQVGEPGIAPIPICWAEHADARWHTVMR